MVEFLKLWVAEELEFSLKLCQKAYSVTLDKPYLLTEP